MIHRMTAAVLPLATLAGPVAAQVALFTEGTLSCQGFSTSCAPVTVGPTGATATFSGTSLSASVTASITTTTAGTTVRLFGTAQGLCGYVTGTPIRLELTQPRFSWWNEASTVGFPSNPAPAVTITTLGGTAVPRSGWLPPGTYLISLNFLGQPNGGSGSSSATLDWALNLLESEPLVYFASASSGGGGFPTPSGSTTSYTLSSTSGGGSTGGGLASVRLNLEPVAAGGFQVVATGSAGHGGFGQTTANTSGVLRLNVSHDFQVTSTTGGVAFTAGTGSIQGGPSSGRLSAGTYNLSASVNAPSGPTSINWTLRLTPLPCYANCDASTTFPAVNALDFSCFLARYQAAVGLSASEQVASYPNCDGSTTFPAVNSLDFSCFLARFRAGCS